MITSTITRVAWPRRHLCASGAQRSPGPCPGAPKCAPGHLSVQLAAKAAFTLPSPPCPLLMTATISALVGFIRPCTKQKPIRTDACNMLCQSSAMRRASEHASESLPVSTTCRITWLRRDSTRVGTSGSKISPEVTTTKTKMEPGPTGVPRDSISPH